LFNLRSSNDSPGPILRREFARLLYTEAHPSGRTPTFERIQKITRDDLVKFHEKYFHPNEVMLGITGDFNKAEMLQLVKEVFGGWQKSVAQGERAAEAGALLRCEAGQSVTFLSGPLGRKPRESRPFRYRPDERGAGCRAIHFAAGRAHPK
jgi:zinc protease